MAGDDPFPSEGEDKPDPWVGRTLAGHAIIRKIGVGGMGVVYLGRHLSLNRLVAVKFLSSAWVHDAPYLELFLREARAAAQLNHPNIVTVYEAGSEGDEVYYFIMEYVDGRDLLAIGRQRGKFPVIDAVRYTREAAAALAYAHSRQIIHRDIKPENLILTKDGSIKVTDMGLAKRIGMDGSMTQWGWIVGSPAYISPERLKDPGDVDARTDIYSLGVTLYELVTGQTPYQDDSPAVVASQHLTDHVPDPRQRNPHLDLDLCNIIQRMMAKNREDRYQTMQEVVTVLADYQNRLLHAPAQPEQTVAPRKPRSALRILGNLIPWLLLLAVGAWFGGRLSRSPAGRGPDESPDTTRAPIVPPATDPMIISGFNRDDPFWVARQRLATSQNCTAEFDEAGGFERSGGLKIDYRLSQGEPAAEARIRLLGIDTTGYRTLRFIVRSNGSQWIGFSARLMAFRGAAEQGKPYIVNPVGPQWTLIEIPLDQLGLPSTDLSQLIFRFDASATDPVQGSISIDELALDPKSAAPAGLK